MHYKRFVTIAYLLLAVVVSGCNGLNNSNAESPDMDKPATSSIEVGIEPANSGLGDTPAALVFYLRNNSQAEQQYLKWNTPLETPLSADIFQVMSEDGQRSAYVGRKVKRGAPSEQDYRTIAAGEEITVRINLAQYYDITAAGKYTVQLSDAFSSMLLPKGSAAKVLKATNTVELVIP